MAKEFHVSFVGFQCHTWEVKTFKLWELDGGRPATSLWATLQLVSEGSRNRLVKIFGLWIEMGRKATSVVIFIWSLGFLHEYFACFLFFLVWLSSRTFLVKASLNS